MTISTIFFGTHNFAAKILAELIKNGSFDITLAVTQPDRPAGRKQDLEIPAVKLLAEKNNIPVAQPAGLSLRGVIPFPDFYDLNILCQYGNIITKEILDKSKYGSINVHPSLLPRYRGASPIQSALVNGETETGVSIILMDEELDHGPILAQKKMNIGDDDNFVSLSAKLSYLSAPLLVNTALDFVNGKITPGPQNHDQATFCKQLSREDGKIDFNKSAKEIYNQWRGLAPWPGVWASWENKRLKFINISPLPLYKGDVGRGYVRGHKLIIACAQGAIEILELQLEGKKPMVAAAFINGYGKINGAILR
ncbi:methionyl-tRNA formyltransferase [Patescibacteria group bacterium]|nr:MAG: methionyl-tRNA formyltransferase [Patescibacteria group bacterium]